MIVAERELTSIAAAAARPPTASQPLIVMKGIGVQFGSVQALSGVDLEILAGELHCILGENGAGKSTLMKVLAGIQPAHRGELVVRGERRVLRNRRDGIVNGIGIVQQHHGLVEQLTGVENFLLNKPATSFWLGAADASRRLSQIAGDLHIEVDTRSQVSRLATGERQRLEIVIALASNSDLVILDEPTSALPTRDVDLLIRLLDDLRKRGKAIVYITHKLREVQALADRVTVLRRGKVVARLHGEDVGGDLLAAAMMGSMPPAQAPAARELGDEVFAIRGVHVRGGFGQAGLHDVSLEIRAGEIVGIAGMLGSGQTELARVAAGLLATDAGEIKRLPRVAAYLPEDRAVEGIAESLSLTDNAIIHAHAQRPVGGGMWIDRGAARNYTQVLIASGDVRADGAEARAGSLSGGNQQKFLVQRELDRNPDLIVAHNPYRGLDAASSRAVRNRLVQARDQGCGVLLISPDLEDLFEISDRILVLSEGHISGSVFPHESRVEELSDMLGKRGKPQ